jgi:hypothetical protein
MKTKKQNKTLAVVIILAATLAISSCQKEKVTTQVKAKKDVKWVDATYNDMLKFALAANSGSFKNDEIFGCATVTDDTVSMPHTRTIDYGSGCVDSDGKTHKGQVVLSYNTTDFLHTPGAYVSASMNNYYIDGNQIAGSLSVHNTGTNGNGNISFTMDVDAKRIMGNGSGTDSVAGQEVVEWVAGSSTPESIDDQFSFTGGAGGSAADGGTFHLSILQPLIKNRASGCNLFFVKGETLSQISGQSDRYLDYGDGTCDNLAVETVDGNSQTITLD